MGKSIKITISLGEILYWLFFGSLLFAKGIGLYDGQLIFKIVLIFAGISFLLKLFIEKYTVAEMIKIAAVIGLTGFTYFVSGEKGMLLYGLMMAGMKYVNLKRVYVLGTILWSAAFLFVTVSSLFHMEDTVYKVHAKLGLGHIFRWSLGYPHPNVLQVSYLILAVFIIYVLGENFKFRHAIWLFAGNLLVFLYSVSYTGFAVFMCLLAGRIYLLFRKKLNIVEKTILMLIFPACVLLSLVAPVTLTGKPFQILNSLLNTRLELAWHYLKPEYISLFGMRLSEIVTETITMDNAYLSAFITYGAVPFIILCAATMYTIFIYLKRNQYLEVLILLTIAIGGLTEPFLYNTSFKNLSFLFMGALLFEKKEDAVGQSVIQIRRLAKYNKIYLLDTSKLYFLLKTVREFLDRKKKKVFTGIVCAVVAVVICNVAVRYPVGYVVYRSDCADLTKEKNYYGDENACYVDYKEMEEFQAGDEVEYFSGNIVLMEEIRNSVIWCIAGYIVGYTGIGIVDRKKRRLKA